MRFKLGLLTAIMTLIATVAVAQQPHEWQLGLQEAASPAMHGIVSFHNLLLLVTGIITAFVAVLMLYVMIRFSKKNNPTPSTVTHNTLIEVVWTVVPILILVGLAIPSFRALYFQDVIPETDFTIKATGAQWYWTYEYPDHDGIYFDSVMLQEDELKPGQPRLLAVDNNVVVPVGKKIRVVVTAADVIHAFTIPSFGFKVDAVPGRLNEVWFQAEKEGIYYGQCSELCGKDHAFMPIAIEVVSDEKFAEWLKFAKEEYASADAKPKTIADASAFVAQ